MHQQKNESTDSHLKIKNECSEKHQNSTSQQYFTVSHENNIIN